MDQFPRDSRQSLHSPQPVFHSKSHSRQGSFHASPSISHSPQLSFHEPRPVRSRQGSFNALQASSHDPQGPFSRQSSFNEPYHARQSSIPTGVTQPTHSPQASFQGSHAMARQSSFGSSFNVYTGTEEQGPIHQEPREHEFHPPPPRVGPHNDWDPANLRPHSRQGSRSGTPPIDHRTSYFPHASRASTPTLDEKIGPYYHQKQVSMDGLTLASGYQPPQSALMYQQDPSSRASVQSDSGWRQRQAIHRGITRRVKLTKGNFVAEYRVASAVYNAIENKYKRIETTEFSHVRYTAATCDPDDFTPANGYTLRQKLFARDTEILIAVTSYNEDKALYARTLHGVMLNVRDICNTRRSRVWKKREVEDGLPGWQRITVALIVDGLESMDKSVLDLLATIGVYQDGLMKRQVDGKEAVAHVFEYTTQLSVDSKPQLVLPQHNDPDNLVPVQIILVVKAKNQRKINSHRWLFNAVGRQLEPECIVLLDAGTKPCRKSIYYLWEAFHGSPNIGGCCGEITAMTGSRGTKLLNPLVAAQNFEYKISNILDKPLESSFGYVSVLPGAFSAYRYKAIQGRPLQQYFLGDPSLADRHGDKGINGMSIFSKNMFLAEDRILCFEVVAKEGEKWTLSYVRESKAETDVPETAAELIGQRRRWLNGSFAASIYSLVHFWMFYKSSHGLFRIFFFHVQALYTTFSLIFSWFALANLWLSFSIIIDLLPNQQGIVIGGNLVVVHWLNESLKYLYLASVTLQFILALGNRPKGERRAYSITLWIFAILSAYLMVCSFWLTALVFKNLPIELAKTQTSTIQEILLVIFRPPVGPLLAAIFGTFGIYFVASVLYGDPWHMFHSFLQYMLLAPSFINVLNVYAFCNLHDVSWGTKGNDKSDALPSIQSNKGKDEEATVMDTTKVQEDIDASFKETVQRALSKPASTSSAPRDKPTLDDENRTFRTRLVALWILCNVALIMVIANLNGWLNLDHPKISRKMVKEFQLEYRERRNVYFAVVLYATAALSVVKFLGCLWFWVKCRLMACWIRKR